ncbi:hypothetical protein KPH14_010827 [Odynerus spinipes]|uniref:Leucine-rich PPR motif-containing protein, mitochondrial n=1 Tax=Odynerus spinipes TaxID=1348599 RepID=A0AAD9RGW0_9HYME|nr:hypothetical protein KPH14_010827 [Odynerus spinipes]
MNDVGWQRSESTDHISQLKKNNTVLRLKINDLIQTMEYKHKKTNIICKRLIEQIIQHIDDTAGHIEAWETLLILRCISYLPQCTPQERIKLANTLWNYLNMYHVPVCISHYNALLQIYIENEHKFSPSEVLSDMKKQQISPNEVTYKYFLEYYCKEGNMHESATILQCIKKNYSMNESIFNLLILGYSQAGDLTSAINIPNIMKKMNITPSEKTYTAIMCAYAKVNDIKSINMVLSYCEKMRIKFSDENILDVIYTLIINNNMDYVNEMFSKIEEPVYTIKIYFLSKVMDIKQDIARNMFLPILFKNQWEVNYDKLVFFYINKLMHLNACPERIIEACVHFETKYHDKKAFNKAVYFSFQHDNELLTLNLLKAWKNRGYILRPHYFWPILIKFIRKNDIQGLLHTLKDMVATYEVVPSIDTLAQFVIPYIFQTLDIRQILIEYGIPTQIIDNAIVYEYLQNNKMRRAAAHVSAHPNVYQRCVLKKVLQQALYNTRDISSFIVIVKKVYTETNSGTCNISIDEIILDMMDFLHTRTSCIPQMINYLYDNKLTVSMDVYKLLSPFLRDNSTPEILKRLENITEHSFVRTQTHDARSSYRMFLVFYNYYVFTCTSYPKIFKEKNVVI